MEAFTPVRQAIHQMIDISEQERDSFLKDCFIRTYQRKNLLNKPYRVADITKELNMLEVNCAALTTLTHHFAGLFKERGKGGIVLLSSMVGFQGVPFAAHYAATKAYVQSLGEALAVELKPSGVDVLTAAPGPVSTKFEERANMRLGKALKPSDVALPILKGLGHKHTVLPGLLTKFLVGFCAPFPDGGKCGL